MEPDGPTIEDVMSVLLLGGIVVYVIEVFQNAWPLRGREFNHDRSIKVQVIRKQWPTCHDLVLICLPVMFGH